MIHSMTAFARQEIHDTWGSAAWELRSVNHRYLELTLRLPDALTNLEPLLRERIKERLQRGKLEINLRYQPAFGQFTQLTVNKELVEQLLKAHHEIAHLAHDNTTANAMHILRWPGVLQTTETDLTVLEKTLLNAFSTALDELITTRQREGKALYETLIQRLAAMQTEISKIRTNLPTILALQREKLLNRLSIAATMLESTRLEQEMVLFAQKIDIAEELDRLDAHILEVQRNLDLHGANGRRLDFLMQELNREANTLGSKSVTSETTLAAVELKLLIEQMREQVQNVE